jgi:hypothetical protein
MAIYGYLMGIDRDITSNFNEMGVSENGWTLDPPNGNFSVNIIRLTTGLRGMAPILLRYGGWQREIRITSW